MKKIIYMMASTAMLAGCGNEPTSDSAATAATEAPVDAGKVESVDVAATPAVPSAFAQCRACHQFEKGKPHSIGPNLWGSFGAAAGGRVDYPYSEPMAASGLTWDAVTLDRYLANPKEVVPGTKMVFAGVADPVRRGEIIQFLETLQDK